VGAPRRAPGRHRIEAVSAPSPEEADLVERARSGDREALEQLLQQHLPGLEAFVRLRVGRAFGPRESAADVVQSACRDAVGSLESFRYGGGEGFRRWLYAIAARKVADKFAFHNADRRDVRREAEAYAGASDEASAILANLSSALSSPSQEVMGDEFLQRLERALEELTPDERDVVLLSRVAGLSRAEVARTLDRSEGAVRNLLHRTLAKLSSTLAP